MILAICGFACCFEAFGLFVLWLLIAVWVVWCFIGLGGLFCFGCFVGWVGYLVLIMFFSCYCSCLVWVGVVLLGGLCAFVWILDYCCV